MRVLLLLLGLLCATGGMGCTSVAFYSSVRYPNLGSGTPRSEVVKELGPPAHSQSFHPAVAGGIFAQAPESLRLAQVSLYDEYHLNGLVLTPDHDPYREYIEGYLTMMYLTLGTAEIFYFPYTTADLAKHAKEHFELRLWYDHSGHLLAEQDRPDPTDSRPNNALQRTAFGRR